MNELKQNQQVTTSSIDSELDSLHTQLGQIENTISACLENFRRFDIPANKLNPDDFFRNNPQCSPENDSSINKQLMPSDPYIKSGTVLRLSELVNYAKQLERQASDLNEYHIVPASIFFERNI